MDSVFKKSSLLVLLKYITIFAVMFVLQKAQLNGFLTVFAFGIFYALIWQGQNIVVLAPLYVLSAYLSSFDLNMLYGAIFASVLMIIIYKTHQKFQKPIKSFMMLVYALICQSGDVFIKIYSSAPVIIVFVELVISLLFMFACMKIFESVKIRGIFQKLTLMQVICGGMLISGIVCGLCFFELSNFSVVKFFVVFCILLFSLTLPIMESACITFVMALGTLLYDNNPYLVAPIMLWYIVCVCFKGKSRVFAALAVLIAELLNVYYFNLYYNTNYLHLSSVFLAVTIILCIKQKHLSMLSDMYLQSFKKRSLQNLVMRNQNNLYMRINKLSNVFYEMDKVFRSMIKGSMAKEEIKQLINLNIKKTTCNDCTEKNRCYRVYKNETEQIFEDLCDIAYEKGRITLIDIPSLLTSRCFKTNQIVFTLNDLISQYKSYASLVSSIDASKVLISEQLSGVSTVLKKLATDTQKNVVIDNGMETEIINELLYNDIVCSDAIVYHNNSQVVSCMVEVKKQDALKSKITNIISKICKTKMIVESEQSSNLSTFQVLNLKTAPKYDVVFGTCAHTKSSSSRSGDCFSIVRLEDGKILMAICDGMGSGEKAEQTSTTAISLIENFYKAGFDSETILASVNKFLSLADSETFSCVDLAIIDLNNLNCDFVKLGATNGFIKHSDTVEIVESKALPLGIISNASVSVDSKYLLSGDMIIICSDGITDSFACDEDLIDYINNISSRNAQEVADSVLDKALENSASIAHDDMTILVAKLFESI